MLERERRLSAEAVLTRLPPKASRKLRFKQTSESFCLVWLINRGYLHWHYWHVFRYTIYIPTLFSLEKIPEEKQLLWLDNNVELLLPTVQRVYQYHRWTWLGVLLLYIFPLPWGFNGRWFLERETALLTALYLKPWMNPEDLASAVWANTKCWPRSWMQRWFQKQLKRRS